MNTTPTHPYENAIRALITKHGYDCQTSRKYHKKQTKQLIITKVLRLAHPHLYLIYDTLLALFVILLVSAGLNWYAGNINAMLTLAVLLIADVLVLGALSFVSSEKHQQLEEEVKEFFE